MDANKQGLILKEEVYSIIGAAIEVSTVLDCWFPEAVYQKTLKCELQKRRIPFEAQKRFKINYKGHTLVKEYISDLFCYGKIIIEIKALNRLSSTEETQVINYLKVSQCLVGLLINFDAQKLEWKHMVLSKTKNPTGIDSFA